MELKALSGTAVRMLSEVKPRHFREQSRLASDWCIRPKNKNTCVTVNLTDPVVFMPTLQFLLRSRKKINKKIVITTDTKIFQKIGRKTKKMPQLQN